MTTLEQVQQTVTDAAVAVTNAVGDAANTTAEALGAAASSVFGLLARTEAAGSREILLVAAQDEYVTPSRTFAVEEV